ncbi:hypothetical protein JCM6292_1811 [Bacteroides pyogenes JCM 6292]|uniref:Uncharacterized protein n=2 Tax=Bacteroides pyogenes TaxID=310300 RepID=W4PHK1_9BACE|nr:hypothetical protein JCM6292_1811 [Bacteroides pyogenes JCM 6292]GAE19257.1 hypothetical protein JCM6294_2286 [Bacteroides pyogenes DSM 20611 = JCM 6294]
MGIYIADNMALFSSGIRKSFTGESYSQPSWLVEFLLYEMKQVIKQNSTSHNYVYKHLLGCRLYVKVFYSENESGHYPSIHLQAVFAYFRLLQKNL